MDQQCPLFLYYLTEIDGFVDTQVIILLFVCMQGRLGIKGQTSNFVWLQLHLTNKVWMD